MTHAELTKRLDSRDKRVNAIRENAQMLAVKQLRGLCADLPDTFEALHLAHNWLVCGKDRDLSRKASRVFDLLNVKCSRLYRIQRDGYLRDYESWKAANFAK